MSRVYRERQNPSPGGYGLEPDACSLLLLTLRLTPADCTSEGPPEPGARRAISRCSSVAQRQSIRLLTGGLLVRIQPEEPTARCKFSLSW